MYNKRAMREDICKFFKDKKLNKNSYYRKWYEKYDKGYIFDYINSYFDDNEEIKELPLGQKLFHIIHNINSLPDKKFLSFKRGYVKGKVTFSGRSINTFLSRLESKKIIPADIICLNEVKQRVVECVKASSYTKLLNDINMLRSILSYTTDISETKYKVAYFLNQGIHCNCGKLRKFASDTTFTLNTTCGDSACISGIISQHGKQRDISYLQAAEIKHKRILSRSRYRHSLQTKRLISSSNKKVWTLEKRQELVRRNRENGVYVKQSLTIRNKILDGTFTPNTLNRLTRKRLKSDITGINSYRSSWEVKFHESNPTLEYEKTRLSYTFEGKEYTYIVDFTDLELKKLYEIKPKELLHLPKNVAKIEAAKEWCSREGYEYIIITQDDLY